MACEFGNDVTKQDFMPLGKYEAISRIATEHGVSSPVMLLTIEPAKPYGESKFIRYSSRQDYGRPVAKVQKEHGAAASSGAEADAAAT
jgi:hypothetical protein